MNINRHVIAFAALLAITGIAVEVGCKDPETALKVKQDAAEADYAAQLLRCVDQATTLAASQACRHEVDIEWRVVVKEAGADQ